MPAAKAKKTTTSPPDLLPLIFEIVADAGWAGFSFDALAEKAGLSLAEIRGLFRSRAAILDALSQRLDQAMLAADREDLKELPPRDRVFELVMSRLEAMAPFRAGLVRLSKEALQHPDLVLMTACRVDRSMAWLQEAAGFSATGLRARLQRRILTGVYLKTLNAWSMDDSSDMAKTMASLDKDLRRVGAFAGLGDDKGRPLP